MTTRFATAELGEPGGRRVAVLGVLYEAEAATMSRRDVAGALLARER